MDSVISKISQIESSATAIMDDASSRKKALAQDLEERTAAFDAKMETETTKQLDELRARMEVDMNAQLKKQQEDTDQILRQMEDNYQANHEAYAMKLFQTMIEE